MAAMNVMQQSAIMSSARQQHLVTVVKLVLHYECSSNSKIFVLYFRHIHQTGFEGFIYYSFLFIIRLGPLPCSDFILISKITAEISLESW